MHPALQQFHPVIGRWFEERVGLPTPPQMLGWPEIAAGRSALILAPTGSGKTLAAFLAAIDWLARRLIERPDAVHGVQILYLSPLKSLANDVQKNLVRPLGEIADVAGVAGAKDWPEIRVAVRTGDTPQKERAAIARDPPHLLITTPESLNLMLTSQVRAVLRTVKYVIVDEVHALAGNKRGVFTSLLLERLEEERKNPDIRKGRLKIAPGVYVPAEPPGDLVRIGLSATARPEEAITRWLGGFGDGGEPRAVAICRAGQRKRLDLSVVCPFTVGDAVEDTFDEADGARGKTHWPQVADRVRTLIREHHSTLVFANSRRIVERLNARLIEGEEIETAAILPHHGSIAKEVRLETEQKLKRGELSAVVATSSLELGIDVGALDLVVQIDSPGSVAAALQRVGRAGHLEKATAKGRLIARRMAELPALGALVPLMLEGTVEETHTPQNCLDVLAQEIVAACVTRAWPRGELFRVFARSAAYRTLREEQFDSVVAMLSRKTDRTTTIGLRPKIAWDRVNDQLLALPGSARLAITNGGVIADTGSYAVYVVDKNVRIGELDEEFVYETKEGDRVVLGSQAWEVVSIDTDRVLVRPGEPGSIRMPFWRGEMAPRTELLGQATGTFCRDLETRLDQDAEAARRWLIDAHRMDDAAADTLIEFVRRQAASAGLPTDRRVIVEHFVDRTGEPVIAVMSPLGSRVNYALRLALETRFAQERLPVQIVHHDDGLLMRPPAPELGGGAMPGDPLTWLSAGTLEPLIVEQLETSALFGLRFRQNAARALMLPRPNVGRRTPLWQQRLRARHLLALVQRERNFPIVLETYRECLQDALHLERAREFLAAIAAGEVHVQTTRHARPSPLAWSLFSGFQQDFQYAGDSPLGGGATPDPTVDASVLDAILQRRTEAAAPGAPAWTDEDVETLRRRITGSEYPARTPEELLEKIEAAGTLAFGSPDDPAWQAWSSGDVPAMLRELLASRRLLLVALSEAAGDARWVATESLAPLLTAIGSPRPAAFVYDRANRLVSIPWNAFPPALLRADMTQEAARQYLVEAAAKRQPLITPEAIARELPFMAADVGPILEHLARTGMLVRLSPGQYALAEYVDQLRNIALRRQRNETHAADVAALQRHLLRWHHVSDPRPGVDALEDVLDTLTGVRLALETWEFDVLPVRVRGFTRAMLDETCAAGHRVWVGHEDASIAFWPRHLLLQRGAASAPALSELADRVLAFLRQAGASFQVDVELALDLTGDEAASALRELAVGGLVSNDRIAALRAVLAAPRRMDGEPRPSPKRRLQRGWWKEAATSMAGGRWFVLPPASAPGDALGLAERAADRAERLLRRHGFACRELLDSDAAGVPLSWRSVYDVLTRMEWAGSVRRGYFVEGITGSQFALPGVHLGPGGDGAVQWLSMLDPANLYARMETRWQSATGEPARVPRVPGSWIAIVNGRPVLAAVSWGERLIPLAGDELATALSRVADLLPRIPHEHRPNLLVRQWGDADVVGSPAEGPLMQAGFTRDMQGLRLYRSYAPGGADQATASPEQQ